MTIFAQWRAFVGPLYLPTTDASHYDYTAHSEGDQTNFGALATTVSTTLADGATSLVVASAASLPTKGGVWVGPNGTGQGWEYVRYTGKSSNTLTGLVRETSADREHNGIHTAGAVVRLWWPITSDDGGLHFVDTLDGNLAASTWTAEIGGVNAPRAALRAGHICIVQWRQTPAGTWENWLIGFLDAPQIKDDARRLGEWRASIVSIATLLQGFYVNGVRVGDLDMAKYAVGSSSDTVLVDFDGERAAGDFTAATPEVGPESAADREPGTLWMGERYLGTPNTFSGNTQITGVYINPPAGARPGSRWIEITANGSGVSNMSIHHSDNNANRSGVEWNFGGPGGTVAGDKLILCEDKTIFGDQHPLSEEVFIAESASFFAGILATDGTLCLRLPSSDAWYTPLKWGNGYGVLQGAPGGSDPPTPTTVTAPQAGQTIRYQYASPAGWKTDSVQTAGYSVKTLTETAPWLRVDLPPLGLTLRDDITAGAPGASGTLYLTNGADASTLGLPSSGVVQIGSEQISYSAKVAGGGLTVTARGANSTTAAAHKAGDVIYVVVSGVATQAHLVKSIGWKRSGGTIYPKQYRIRVSAIEDARSPDDGGVSDYDWTQIYYTTSNAAGSLLYTLPTPLRVRSVLFQFESMTADPARPRLNEVIANVDSSTFDGALVLAEGTAAATVVQRVALNAGLPSGAIVIPYSTVALTGLTTGQDTAWKVISDMADYARLRVTVTRGSRLRVEPDPYWTNSGAPTQSRTWTRVLAQGVELVRKRADAVSQVEIAWRSPDGATSGTVRYPATPWADGTVQRITQALYVDGTAALAAATRMFYLRRYPYTWLVECADAYPDVKAGEVDAVEWQTDITLPATDRLALVQSAEHGIDGSVLTSVLNLIEIERTSAA